MTSLQFPEFHCVEFLLGFLLWADWFQKDIEWNQLLISLHFMCRMSPSCPLQDPFSPRSAGRKWVQGERSVTIYAQLVWIIQPLRRIRRLPLDPIINHPLIEHQARLGSDSLAECCYLAPGEACSQSCNSHHALRSLHIFEQLHSVLSWRRRKSGVHFRQLAGSCFPLLDISKVCQLVNL